MARIYWIRGSTTAAQEDTLHAQLCRDLLIGNAEAAYETAGWDQPIVYDAAYTMPVTPLSVPVSSHVLVPLWYDRDGCPCDVIVDILAASGAGVQKTFTAYLLPTQRTPDAYDQTATWTCAAGATLAWRGVKTITVPRDWPLEFVRTFSDGTEEEIVTTWVWLIVYVTDPAADTAFGGLRVKVLPRVT